MICGRGYQSRDFIFPFTTSKSLFVEFGGYALKYLDKYIEGGLGLCLFGRKQ